MAKRKVSPKHIAIIAGVLVALLWIGTMTDKQIVDVAERDMFVEIGMGMVGG